jgi:hypothetical protein
MNEANRREGATDRAPPPGAPASDIDPFSLEFFADPFPAHQELREAGPAVWLRRYGVWASVPPGDWPGSFEAIVQTPDQRLSRRPRHRAS